MIDERLETQASLYVIGALPPDEAREFERTLQTNRELQQLVAELRDSADALLLASPAVEPPAHLKQKILARLESGAERQSKIVPLSQPETEGPSMSSFMPWALAAGLAVVCGVAIFQQSKARRENFALQGQLTELTVKSKGTDERLLELSRQVNDLVNRDAAQRTLLANLTNQLNEYQTRLTGLSVSNRAALDRIAELVSTNSELQKQLAEARDPGQLRVAMLESTNAAAVVVWNNQEQKGRLQVFRLPPPPAGKDYQLWVIDPRYPSPVSAGVFQLDEKGVAIYAFNATSPISTPDKFAISLENKGGVAVPTQVVLVSN